jgi:hypothetical protein
VVDKLLKRAAGLCLSSSDKKPSQVEGLRMSERLSAICGFMPTIVQVMWSDRVDGDQYVPVSGPSGVEIGSLTAFSMARVSDISQPLNRRQGHDVPAP